MAAPAQCPGCGTRLQPDWESCPNCPLSFRDAPPEKTAFQSDGFRNVVLPLIIFGGIAYGVWAMASFFWKSAETGTRESAAVVKKTIASASTGAAANAPLLPGAVEEPGSGSKAPAGAAGREDEDKPEEGSGVISVTPSATTREIAVTEWKLRGHVYDLLTLRPVAGAKIIFSDNETNVQAMLVTDAAGLYRTILPALQGHGYLVMISKPGYAKAYPNPGSEDVSKMALSRRKELSRELGTMVAAPIALEPPSEKPYVTNFHLAPQ